MDNFIGNHIKFIVNWGQLIMVVLILFCIWMNWISGRKNKYFLPATVTGWIGFAISFFMIVVFSLVFARITMIKPGASKILSRLETLKGQKAPPLFFRLISDSTEHNLEEFKGKVVLVNYWATWCPPCLEEMPDLNRLYTQFNDQKLTVIAVSDEARKDLIAFNVKRHMDLLVGFLKVFNWVDMGSERPVSFLVDKKGVIREYFTGSYDYIFFQSRIQKYLAEQ